MANKSQQPIIITTGGGGSKDSPLGLVAGLIAIGGAGLGGYWAYNKYQAYVTANGGPYVSSSGSSGFLAWVLAGLPAFGTSSHSATISVSNTSIAFNGTTYTPSSFVISGTGFTPGGVATVLWITSSASNSIGTTTISSTGTVSATVNLGSGGFNPSSGSAILQLGDSSSGIISNAINMAVTSSTTPGPTVAPYIILNVNSTQLSGNSGSYTYNPSTVTVTGTGFTTGGVVQFYSVNSSTPIASATASFGGDVTVSIAFSSFQPTPGSGGIYAVDYTTSIKSNTSSFSYVAPSIISTTISGYTLLPSQWTDTGTYGSNTNPITWGNWVVSFASGSYYGNNFSIAGYYQNYNGTAEIYFGNSAAQVSWLNANGWPTTAPVVNPGNPLGGSTPGSSSTNPIQPNSNGTLPALPAAFASTGAWYNLTYSGLGVTSGVYGGVAQAFINAYNSNVLAGYMTYVGN